MENKAMTWNIPLCRSGRAIAVSMVLVGLLTGCGSLLQPDVETELAELRPGSYEVDPRHTTVLFKVAHLGLTKFVGRFNDFDATLDYDPENPEAAKLDAVIRTASIDVSDSGFEDSLRGGTWFDSDNFPEARFKTTGVEIGKGNSARFTGDFTLLGVTAPITLDVVFNGGAYNMLTGRYTLGFSATGIIARSTFGMDKYIPAVGDEVEIEVHAEFLKR
jgi:polyisoprenoid-binding protein YceI